MGEEGETQERTHEAKTISERKSAKDTSHNTAEGTETTNNVEDHVYWAEDR